MRPAFSELAEVQVSGPLGGLVDGVIEDALQNSDASKLINFHMDRGGYTKRRGRFLVATLPTATGAWSLFHFRTDTTRKLLLVVGDAGQAFLVLIPEAGGVPVGAVSGVWPPTVADLIGTGRKLGAMVEYNHQAFYADGGTILRYWSGSATGPWGYQGGALPAPTNDGVSAGGSLTDTKWYGFGYAYRDPVRKLTTNPSARFTAQSTTPNLTQKGIVPAFAGWDASFTEVVLLRTSAQLDATQAAAASLSRESVVTGVAGLPINVTWSAADDQLQVFDAGLDNAPPVPMDFITIYLERIFGFKGSKVFFSKNGATESGVHAFPPINEVPVELNVGDPIGGMFVLQGQLFVVKTGLAVFRLVPIQVGDILQFEVEKVTGASVGCIATFSVVVAEGYAYWFDERGVVEFDGTISRLISDSPAPGQQGIRDTISAARATGRLRYAYGSVDRQADRRIIRWIIPRTVEIEGLQYEVSDHLLFDLAARRWIGLEQAGGNPASDRMTGLYERGFCLSGPGTSGGFYRDSDEASWVYSFDEDGNVYRLRTDENNVEVYADNGTPFTAQMRSKWFGNGLDPQLPVTVEAEVRRSVEGKKTGALTLSLWRDGEDDPAPRTEDFALWDILDQPDATMAICMNADREPARRVAIGLTHSEDDGDLTVSKLGLRAVPLGRTQRGT